MYQNNEPTLDQLIVGQLEKSAATARELKATVPRSSNRIYQSLKRLRDTGKLHISAYEYTPSIHRFMPVYAVGGGTDVVHPLERPALDANMKLLNDALFGRLNYNVFEGQSCHS